MTQYAKLTPYRTLEDRVDALDVDVPALEARVDALEAGPAPPEDDVTFTPGGTAVTDLAIISGNSRSGLFTATVISGAGGTVDVVYDTPKASVPAVLCQSYLKTRAEVRQINNNTVNGFQVYFETSSAGTVTFAYRCDE